MSENITFLFICHFSRNSKAMLAKVKTFEFWWHISTWDHPTPSHQLRMKIRIFWHFGQKTTYFGVHVSAKWQTLTRKSVVELFFNFQMTLICVLEGVKNRGRIPLTAHPRKKNRTFLLQDISEILRFRVWPFWNPWYKPNFKLKAVFVEVVVDWVGPDAKRGRKWGMTPQKICWV